MNKQAVQDGIERENLPNGRLSSEFTIKKGMRHGRYRLWHENGILAEQGHYRNEQLHGIIRKWNTKGQLLGTCSFNNGTGILRQWHENGQMTSEISHVRGLWTGRMRCWDQDGLLYGQCYFLDGRPISKKAYVQKCKRIKELPRFENEKTANTLGNYVRGLRRAKRGQAKSVSAAEDLVRQKWFDKQCKLEAKEKSSKKLLAWLTKGSKQHKELGEMSKRQALQFTRKLYSLGVVSVWATRIERDEDGAEYSKRLVVALPGSSTKQSKIYQLCADPARPSMGSADPAIRVGKKFMSVSLM